MLKSSILIYIHYKVREEGCFFRGMRLREKRRKRGPLTHIYRDEISTIQSFIL